MPYLRMDAGAVEAMLAGSRQANAAMCQDADTLATTVNATLPDWADGAGEAFGEAHHARRVQEDANNTTHANLTTQGQRAVDEGLACVARNRSRF